MNDLMLCVASESFVLPLQRLPEPLIIKPIGRAEYFEVNLFTCDNNFYAYLSEVSTSACSTGACMTKHSIEEGVLFTHTWMHDLSV